MREDDEKIGDFFSSITERCMASRLQDPYNNEGDDDARGCKVFRLARRQASPDGGSKDDLAAVA